MRKTTIFGFAWASLTASVISQSVLCAIAATTTASRGRITMNNGWQRMSHYCAHASGDWRNVALILGSQGLIARCERDYALADRIREQLRERGVAVEDTPAGPRSRVLRPG